jgi:hypothetical protein
MRFRSVLVPFVAGVLVLGCDDPASAPAESPDLRAAQGDRSEWTLQYVVPSIPADDPLYAGVLPCANGGAGEDVYVSGGPYMVYEKSVVTPSGNVINQGRIVADYERWEGAETGDVWFTSLDAKLREFIRAVDGHYLALEPITQILTNAETGEQLRIKALYRLEFDELGNVVNNNARFGEIFACHAMK